MDIPSKKSYNHPKNKFHFLNNHFDEILNLDSAEPGNPVDNCDIDAIGLGSSLYTTISC